MGSFCSICNESETTFGDQIVKSCNMNSMRCLVIAIFFVTMAIFVLSLVACSDQKEQKKAVEFTKWRPQAVEKVDRRFRQVFDRYWVARSNLNWPIIYSMEAPHVRWAYSDTDFYRKFGRAGRVVSVEVLGVDKVHSKVVDASLKVVFRNPFNGREDTMYPKDRWIEVNGNWYHVWKITLLDKFI